MKKILITTALLLNIAIGQISYIGIAYNWEVFQYDAVVNPDFVKNFGDYPKTSAFELNQWEISYFSKKLISIYLSIGFGSKKEKQDLKTSSNAFVSMALGIGPRWFEFYGGAKIRMIVNLKQKAIDKNKKKKETWLNFKNSETLLSYAVFQGVKLIIGDALVVYAELEENLYPFKYLVSSEAKDTIPAFKRLAFSTFSARIGIALLFKI